MLFRRVLIWRKEEVDWQKARTEDQGGFEGGFGKVWRQEEVPGFTEEAGLSGSVVRSDTTGPL